MLSRVADSIYWMNRYVERADSVARFVDVNLHLALDLPEGASEQWEPLVATTGDDAFYAAKYGPATRANVMRFLTFDPDYPSSMLACLSAARENARSVREIISSEMWETINRSYLMVKDAAAREAEVMTAPHEFFQAVKLAAQQYLGVAYVTMSHNEAWHFGRLGRLLERADKTSRILDVKYFLLLPDPSDVGSPYDEIQWAALLKSASGLEMYRKSHRQIVPDKVVAFLLLDRNFPRSMRYCVHSAESSLHRITGRALDVTESEAERRLGRLRGELEYAVAGEIVAGGLHEYLDRFQIQLNAIGDAVVDGFFRPHQTASQSP